MPADDDVRGIFGSQASQPIYARPACRGIKGHVDLPGGQLSLILCGVAGEDQVGTLPLGDIRKMSRSMTRGGQRPKPWQELIPIANAYGPRLLSELLHVKFGYVPGAYRLLERPLEVVFWHKDRGIGEEGIVADVIPVAVGQHYACHVLTP